MERSIARRPRENISAKDRRKAAALMEFHQTSLRLAEAIKRINRLPNAPKRLVLELPGDKGAHYPAAELLKQLQTTSDPTVNLVDIHLAQELLRLAQLQFASLRKEAIARYKPTRVKRR